MTGLPYFLNEMGKCWCSKCLGMTWDIYIMNIKIDDQNDAEIVNSTKKQWQTPWSSPEKSIVLFQEAHCFFGPTCAKVECLTISPRLWSGQQLGYQIYRQDTIRKILYRRFWHLINHSPTASTGGSLCLPVVGYQKDFQQWSYWPTHDPSGRIPK